MGPKYGLPHDVESALVVFERCVFYKDDIGKYKWK